MAYNRYTDPPYYITAYGLAVKHGYQGTEEEWLASLQGHDAYTEAVNAGYEGTEQEFYAMLAAAADTAENMPLYLRYSEDAQTPFAIAVCDINGLKKVNDLKRHPTGDKYIVNACRIICDQFKHSPVFRIGGDEFVAILQGNDYREREELQVRFMNQNGSRAKVDEIVIACGLSAWRPDAKESFEEVFKRANEKMYQNKLKLITID